MTDVDFFIRKIREEGSGLRERKKKEEKEKKKKGREEKGLDLPVKFP